MNATNQSQGSGLSVFVWGKKKLRQTIIGRVTSPEPDKRYGMSIATADRQGDIVPMLPSTTSQPANEIRIPYPEEVRKDTRVSVQFYCGDTDSLKAQWSAWGSPMTVCLNAPMSKMRKISVFVALMNFFLALWLGWNAFWSLPELFLGDFIGIETQQTTQTPAQKTAPSTVNRLDRNKFLRQRGTAKQTQKPATPTILTPTPAEPPTQITIPKTPSIGWWIAKALYALASIIFFLYSGIWTGWQWIHDRFFEPQTAYQIVGVGGANGWQMQEDKQEFRGHAQWGAFKLLIIKFPFIPKWVKEWVKEM